MLDIDKILEFKQTNLPPEQGKILISEPFLRDFFFKRSIVLLAEHNEEGSFGLIINKPVDYKLNEVVLDFPHFDVPVYIGGPVKTDSLFFIHTIGQEIKGSFEIFKGLYWGGDIESVKDLIEQDKITREQIKFFVGYSGWAPKQLDRELTEDSWVISNTKITEVMFMKPDNLWERIVKRLGNEYQKWLNFPTDPGLN